MTKRTLRNAIMLGIAVLSASLEAPHLARQPFSAATVELADASAALDRGVSRVASNLLGSHLGFDTNIYPGDKAMDAWREAGDYEWVGYYLKAPCHSDGSWSGTRDRLVDKGWGLAVVYVGQQTWGRKLTNTVAVKKPSAAAKSKKSKSKHKAHGRTMTRRSAAPVAKAGARCSAAFVNSMQGQIDARDAIAKTSAEGFAKGSVVFLDVEYMESVPKPMRDYYRAWTRTVLADGRYQPGIYAHTRNAQTIYNDVSDVYDDLGIETEPPFWIAGSNGFSPGRAPTDVGHKFASAWQGVLDVVRTHNGVKLPIDISVASVASPSLAATQ
jgi:hypothetical protein